MGNTSGMAVQGMDALVAKLKAMQGTPLRDAEDKLLPEAAEVIRVAAQDRVNVRTAKLQGKIAATRITRKKGYASIKVGVPRNEGVAYGIPLEWGHVNRDGSVTQPYPFMQPAYESKKDEAYGIIRDGLAEAIREAGGTT